MSYYQKRGAALVGIGTVGILLTIIFSAPDNRPEQIVKVFTSVVLYVVSFAVAYLFLKGNIMPEKTLDAAPCARDPQEVEVIKALADAHNALEGDWNNNRQSNFGKLLIERDLALQALLGYYLRAGVIDKVEIMRSKRIPPPAQTVNEVPWDGK